MYFWSLGSFELLFFFFCSGFPSHGWKKVKEIGWCSAFLYKIHNCLMMLKLMYFATDL